MANNPTSSHSQLKGVVVKQVLSGDAIIVRGAPKGGPPPEKQINFSNVTAPKLGRRASSNLPETEDEPYAWESREFLRKKLIGKEVVVTLETKTNTGREYGTIYLGKSVAGGENMTELMINEGLVRVRRESLRGDTRLPELEDVAKANKVGLWAGNDLEHKRKIHWAVENTKLFVDKHGRKPVSAVIEHVRDGSTVRAVVLPDYYYITLMISGIRCPGFKLDSEGKPDKSNIEPFAEEAKYFVESKLLQRDIEIILETASNNNLVGSILHPNGNIAEVLLKEGLAKCLDWTIATVAGGAEKLRTAERYAKQRKLKLWKDYNPPTSQIAVKEREFTAKVVEVINGDSMNVKKQDGSIKKIFLASIRQPRPTEDSAKNTGRSSRPLYDIPGLFQAREFLRKKVVGHKVNITIDYIQPAQNNYPEKVCCTVKIGQINVAEALVSKGLATVVRYRQDDDQRANCYDDLLSAEAKAIKSNKGIHSKDGVTPLKVSDLTSDSNRAKGNLASLQRTGRHEAIVEFVASGSRMRLYIERETCLLTFLLAGISCPKPSRPMTGGGGFVPEEPYGAEALAFTKELILQRTVEVEIDSMDKGGNFIGFLHVDGKNLSVALVEEGLSSVHVTAENSKYYSQLAAAENQAKSKSLKIYENFIEIEKAKQKREVVTERKINLKPVMISEVTDEGKAYVQYCSDEVAIEKMRENLLQEFSSNPPLGGSYTPKRGDICACKFSGDGEWYRAKIREIEGDKISVFFIDYGNKEVTARINCAALPSSFTGIPGYAHDANLAFIKFYKDEDYLQEAVSAFKAEVESKKILINSEYQQGNDHYYTMQHSDSKVDIGKTLLSQGLVLVDKRREKVFQSILSDYYSTQEEAKKQHLNIWQYGDVTEDDALEFGMER